MLNINEYNKLLYQNLDKETKKKEMMSNYGNYIQHSKGGSESGIELQAATWLANYNGIIRGERFTQTPQGMKQICEGLIPQASKLLRKANKKGAPEETKAELRNARKFLEDCLADANAALQHSDEEGHIEHGQKWRKHKYVRIENGRYIYPEDLRKEVGSTNTLAGGGLREEVYSTNKPAAVKPAGPQGPVATGTTKHKAPGLGPIEYSNVQAVKLFGKEDATKKEGPIKKRRRDEAIRNDVKDFVNSKTEARDIAKKGEAKEKIYDQIKNSKEVTDYANEINKAYAAGLIEMSNKNPADFDTTDKNWRDNRAYDALLETANKMEDYCKKLASESDGVTDWPEIRKELEMRILPAIIEKSYNDRMDAKEKEDKKKQDNWRKNRDAAYYAGADRAQKQKVNG